MCVFRLIKKMVVVGSNLLNYVLSCKKGLEFMVHGSWFMIYGLCVDVKFLII